MKIFLFFILVLIISNIVNSGDIKVSLNRKGPHGYSYIDNNGRTRIFHGVNAVYKLPPYIPSSKGWDHNSTLSEQDAKNLKDWGFNVVRLGVMWPGVYPAKGKKSDDYIKSVKEVVDILGKYDIYTILDMHQDLGARVLCGEGFPDWAVDVKDAKRPFPQPVSDENYTLDSEGYPILEDCLKVPFFHYYFADAVSAAFQKVYTNFSNDFADFWGAVAEAFASTTTVLGYELINEPWAGDVKEDPTLFFPGRANRENLYRFYEKGTYSIRKYDTNSIVFFEKSLTNILGPLGFNSIPGGERYRDRTAFSWHNYCGSVDREGNPDSAAICRFEQGVQLSQSYHEIESVQCGSFLTEFGAVSAGSTAAIDVLNWLLDQADVEQQSWAYWQYKSYNDITTASNELESFYWKNGTLQSQKVDALCRVYAQAVAGVIKEHRYDREKNAFHLSYRMLATIDSAPTVIYIGPLQNVVQSNSSKYKLEISINPVGAANATFSKDNLQIFIDHINGSWKEGDELTVDIFVSGSVMQYYSITILLILLFVILMI